jgi:hypothetical protein
MRIVHVVPRDNRRASLKSLLNEKRRELRQRGRGTFRLKAGRWVHTTYPGSIALEQKRDGELVATLRQRGPTVDWQLLNAFMGYLDRHFAEDIDTVTVEYPKPAARKRPSKKAAARRR